MRTSSQVILRGPVPCGAPLLDDKVVSQLEAAFMMMVHMVSTGDAVCDNSVCTTIFQFCTEPRSFKGSRKLFGFTDTKSQASRDAPPPPAPAPSSGHRYSFPVRNEYCYEHPHSMRPSEEAGLLWKSLRLKATAVYQSTAPSPWQVGSRECFWRCANRLRQFWLRQH